jgi:hypothetical protein
MMSKEIEYLPHSSGCFLCGDENTCGVQAKFFVEGNNVRARLALPSHLNGYKDIAHGGVLAGLLDETMGWAATVFGKEHPFYVTGELICHSKVCVRAKGKFIPMSHEATAEVVPYLKFDQCRKYRTLFDRLKKR